MKTVRIQFELPEDKVKVLDAIMEDSGIKTRVDLFNNAMTLLKWAIKQRKEGRVIASIDYGDNTLRELIMPLLEDIEEASGRERELVASGPIR